jgi:Methylmalonic aciduria and homocystinuria type D protein
VCRPFVQFCEFAKAACDLLAARGYWADYIDPCSGLPVGICMHILTPCSSEYSPGVASTVSSSHCLLGLTPLRACHSIGMQMVHKESTVPYGEVEGFSTLLGYKTSNAGCCKVCRTSYWHAR